MRRLLLGFGGLAAFLLVWEAAGPSGLIAPGALPPPSTVLVRIGTLLADPAFRTGLVATVAAWLLSLALTVVVAVPVGLVLGSVPGLRAASSAVIDFVRPVPAVALTPLCVVMFGAGPTTKIVLAVLAGTWPLLFNVLHGLREVDRVQIETARAFRAPAWRIALQVRLPSVVPFALTGLRIALGLELIVVVSTEFLAGIGYPGLGAYVWNAGEQAGDITTVLAGTLVAGALGYLANQALLALSTRPRFAPRASTASGSETGGPPRWVVGLQRWGTLAGCLAVWQLVTAAARSPFAPPPSDIVRAAVHEWFTGPASHLLLTTTAIGNILPSLGRLGLGWAIAVVVGVGAGVLLGLVRWLGDAVEPLLAFGRSIPASLLIPVLFVLLHAGTEMEIVTIATGAVWPIVLNTIDGVRTVEPLIVDTARVYGTSRVRLVLTTVLPGAFPKIVAGLRVSLSLALIVMVVSELVGASNGIGYQLSQAQGVFGYPVMWAYIALISVLGYVLNRLLRIAENRLVPWLADSRV